MGVGGCVIQTSGASLIAEVVHEQRALPLPVVSRREGVKCEESHSEKHLGMADLKRTSSCSM